MKSSIASDSLTMLDIEMISSGQTPYLVTLMSGNDSLLLLLTNLTDDSTLNIVSSKSVSVDSNHESSSFRIKLQYNNEDCSLIIGGPNSIFKIAINERVLQDPETVYQAQEENSILAYFVIRDHLIIVHSDSVIMISLSQQSQPVPSHQYKDAQRIDER